MCQKKKKLLTKCHASKKGKTADKVSCLEKKEKNTADKVLRVNNIYYRKIRLPAICHASNTKLYIYIYNIYI